MTNLGTGLGEGHVAVILVLVTDRSSQKQGNAEELLRAMSGSLHAEAYRAQLQAGPAKSNTIDFML